MAAFTFVIDFILHIDRHLQALCAGYGLWVYAILFVIVFCETGLVVTPFLPGDSLLFAVGSLAAIGALDLTWVILILIAAAIIGDSVNYTIGHTVGPKVFHQEHGRLLNKEYLLRTHAFYEKHGGKTIVIARFLPIIRTFAPFVAGISKMTYGHFISYNIIGGIIWPAVFLFTGYFFGSVPFVQEHFSLIAIAIIVISFIPVFIEFFKARRESKASKQEPIA